MACIWGEELARFFAAQGGAIHVERSLAAVALVGPNTPEIDAARRALDEAGLEVHAQWAETNRGSALFALSESALPVALRAIHAAVFEVRAPIPSLP